MPQSETRARGWIIDVDGCLVRAAKYGGDGGEPIAGAAEFLALLESRGEPYIVCTNASGKHPSAYAESLRRDGIPIPDERFETAGSMTVAYLAERHAGEKVVVVGTDAFIATAREAGVDVAEGAERATAAAVIIADGAAFTTDELNAAALAVDAGAAFYCTVGQRWFQGGVGKGITSSALIAGGISWTTGISPVVTGKPSLVLGSSLAARMGVAPENVVVVGDALAEVELARVMGGTSYLVLTGGVDRATAESLPEDRRASSVFDSIADVLALIEAEDPSAATGSTP